jgi:hypothetical protein
MKIPVPRPLLIIIVIIVILGVVSCGAGVLRGLNEEPEPAPGSAAHDAGIDGLIDGPVKAEDIVTAGVDDACLVSVVDRRITLNGSCNLVLEPVALLPRVLKLEIDAGSADQSVEVEVTQEIDGEEQSGSDTVSPTAEPDIEVSAAGSSSVHVRLTCSGCTLHVID